MVLQGLRKERRPQHGQHAEAVGRPDAEGDEREHVQAAGAQRAPRAHEERPGGPEHDWSGEATLGPARDLAAGEGAEGGPWRQVGHCEGKHRQGQDAGGHQAPEQSPALAGLGLVRTGCKGFGLQRHAALDAVAGMRLAHLGMHGTDVVRTGWGRGLGRGVRSGEELPAAVVAAEVVGLPAAFRAEALRLVDGHAADGIGCHGFVCSSPRASATALWCFLRGCGRYKVCGKRQ